MRLRRTLGAALLLLGSLYLLMVLTVLWRGRPLVQRGLQAYAIVYEIQSYEDEPVRYLLEWQHEGETLRGWMTSSSLKNIERLVIGDRRYPRRGDEVPVFYDPDAPQRPVVRDQYEHAQSRLIPAVLAPLIGAILLFAARPRKGTNDRRLNIPK